MGELIKRGTVPHTCKPFMDEQAWTLSSGGSISYEVTPPVGTIWRCECGILWEVVGPRYVNTFGNRWAEAGLKTRFKVWRMLRKSEVGKHDIA